MRLQRAEWATALLITLFAVALHASRLVHAGPLWRDEAGAFHLATAPSLAQVIARHESFPPPFFLIVRVWVALTGGSDASVRLFGLLVGLGLLALLWWTSRRTARTVPLVGLGLVALNPTVLIFGDSLRGYGLGTVAILAAFAAFARLAARPDRRAVIGAGVAAVASVQLLFHNAALLLALGIAAAGVGIVRRRPRVLAAVVGVGAVAALSLLPWAGPVLATRSWSVLLTVPVGPGEIFGEMARAASAPVDALRWVWLALLALGIFGSITPVPNPEETKREDARLFALLSLPAVALAQWGFLEAVGYEPRSWYFLPLLALGAAALDVLLASSPLLRTARLGIAVLAVLTLALPAAGLARVRMSNVDRVAERIAAEAAPGDLVVVAPWYHGISYLRYGGRTRWMTLPQLEDHSIHRYDLVKARMAQPDPLGDVLAAVERTLRSGNRVWVAGELTVPPPGTAIAVLPPAPGAPTGWRELPYLESWSAQLGALLRDRATAGGRVRVPAAPSDGPVSGYERMGLLVFSGWRSETPD